MKVVTTPKELINSIIAKDILWEAWLESECGKYNKYTISREEEESLLDNLERSYGKWGDFSRKIITLHQTVPDCSIELSEFEIHLLGINPE